MKKVLFILTTVCLLSLNHSAFSQTWNAYADFYLDPTAAGWTGSTSGTGSPWGYYDANVNGFGFPTQIGTYFTLDGSGSGSQSLYRFSNYSPLGYTGFSVSSSAWDPTGGAGFPRYVDNQGWGSSLGRYDNTWFPGAPGVNQGLSDLVWMQSGWLGGGSSEGIAPVLTWTAPSTGSFTFTGLFVTGNQPGNGASVAIVDSLSNTLLPRTGLPIDTVQPFSFTQSYTAGDVVEFQVGSDFTTGNAVGLQLNIIPEPGSIALVAVGLGFLGMFLTRSKKTS